jgi:hypothetical protein
MQPSPLANALATVAQLQETGSQLNGIPRDLEDSIRFAGARLTQAAGILLRLPQEVIAQAIVVFTRFWVGAEGGSLAEFGAQVCLYAKLRRTVYLSINSACSKFQLPQYTSPQNSLRIQNPHEASSTYTPIWTPFPLHTSNLNDYSKKRKRRLTMYQKAFTRPAKPNFLRPNSAS